MVHTVLEVLRDVRDGGSRNHRWPRSKEFLKTATGMCCCQGWRLLVASWRMLHLRPSLAISDKSFQKTNLFICFRNRISLLRGLSVTMTTINFSERSDWRLQQVLQWACGGTSSSVPAHPLSPVCVFPPLVTWAGHVLQHMIECACVLGTLCFSVCVCYRA